MQRILSEFHTNIGIANISALSLTKTQTMIFSDLPYKENRFKGNGKHISE